MTHRIRDRVGVIVGIRGTMWNRWIGKKLFNQILIPACVKFVLLTEVIYTFQKI